MKPRGDKLGAVGLLITAVLVLSGCQQAATDTDQAFRDKLANTSWITDTDNFPNDAPQFHVYFYPGGTGIEGGSHAITWAYNNSVFTYAGDLSTDDTSFPELTSSHFYFYYNGNLCHLKRTSS